jgi:hypothetical protein
MFTGERMTITVDKRHDGAGYHVIANLGVNEPYQAENDLAASVGNFGHVPGDDTHPPYYLVRSAWGKESRAESFGAAVGELVNAFNANVR